MLTGFFAFIFLINSCGILVYNSPADIFEVQLSSSMLVCGRKESTIRELSLKLTKVLQFSGYKQLLVSNCEHQLSNKVNHRVKQLLYSCYNIECSCYNDDCSCCNALSYYDTSSCRWIDSSTFPFNLAISTKFWFRSVTNLSISLVWERF